jgi:ADP-ribosyl-[dinitrogen reductase] hydrolase
MQFASTFTGMTTVDPNSQPTPEQRLRGALWGQLVGDAAALGSHWIYNLDVMRQRFPEGLSGFEAPAEGHYHFGKKPGDQTHYGDGALVLLESIAQVGHFDARAFGLRFLEAFEPGLYQGYIDQSTKGTIANYRTFAETHRADEFDFQKGADDDHLGTASRLAGLVVRHRADPYLLNRVESLTRVCQDNSRTIAYMKAHALFLSGLLSGLEPRPALAAIDGQITAVEPEAGPEVQEKCRAALAALEQDVVSATLGFGQSCPLEHSFPAALHAFLRQPDDFKTAILSTLQAGGDNAGRAAMLGAWLGAHLGVEKIPREWRDRLTHQKRIAATVDQIIEAARLDSGRSGG